MFSLKKKYYLIIESIKDINLKNIKKRNKFVVIYRNHKNLEKRENILKFRKLCKLKAIGFYVANNIKLAISLNSDGLYLSAFNKSYRSLFYKKYNFKVIGSAHNIKEIFMKINQGCDLILLSKLFLVNYDKRSKFLGVIKFNNFLNFNKNLIPLGGIKLNNLNKLKNINCKGIAIMSEIKKKPTKIFSRLF
tara:strand:+ start:174 stop:746 length:573 start_codon:yes stop_codon:yes gene_type:complete